MPHSHGDSQLFLGILYRLQEVVGEKAAAGVVRYGATEEARAWTTTARMDSLPKVAEQLAVALGMDVDVESDDAKGAVVAVRGKVSVDDKVREALILGLFTGAFLGVHSARSADATLEREPDGRLKVAVRRTG